MTDCRSFLLGVVLSAVVTGRGDASRAPAPSPPPVVKAKPVVEHDAPISAEWLGSLVGHIRAQIRAHVSGHPMSQNYTEGSVVKAGDLNDQNPLTTVSQVDPIYAELPISEQLALPVFRQQEKVARPVATAVANGLAFDKIQELRSHLEDENLALREEIATTTGAAGGIMEASTRLRTVLERVASVAATDSPALITGETGTGLEASLIHVPRTFPSPSFADRG